MLLYKMGFWHWPGRAPVPWGRSPSATPWGISWIPADWTEFATWPSWCSRPCSDESSQHPWNLLRARLNRRQGSWSRTCCLECLYCPCWIESAVTDSLRFWCLGLCSRFHPWFWIFNISKSTLPGNVFGYEGVSTRKYDLFVTLFCNC